METARAYPCGITDKSRARFVVAGGFNNKELNSVEIFDINSERWLKAPAMPTARTKSGGAIVGDYFAVVSLRFILFYYSLAFSTLDISLSWLCKPWVLGKKRKSLNSRDNLVTC